MKMKTDTIVAVSTPSGRGGIGVVRLSGEPLSVALKMFKSHEITAETAVKSRYMYFGEIVTAGFSDKGYMVYFKAPHSYTGEDTVEFQSHGGMRIVQGIVDECIKLGARPAERGEFTRRAFLNGKMDLADAEGVIDMINADSEVAVNAAYHLMSGHLSLKVKQIQRQLLEVITDLEAVLDYPEELEDEVLPNTPNEIINIKAKLKEIVELQKYGKYIRSGINIAIVGETNAGKSSLLNALINDERAIVSDIRGTTRDTISESLEYRGIKLNFIDTAGIRETDDIIEKEGVKRAKNSALSSDLVIYLIDLADKRATDDDNLLNEFKTKKLIKVFNKIDISNNIIDQCTNEKADKNSFFVSAKTKEGVAELLNAIVQMFEAEKLTSGAAMTNERQNFAVKKAYESICFALENFNDISTDCTLISLKEAWSLLGEITGETVTEDIVDNIFDKFCVGK